MIIYSVNVEIRCHEYVKAWYLQMWRDVHNPWGLEDDKVPHVKRHPPYPCAAMLERKNSTFFIIFLKRFLLLTDAAVSCSKIQ